MTSTTTMDLQPSLALACESSLVTSSAASVCSPTRAACITGMSPAQIHLTTHIPGKAGRRHPAQPGGPVDAESINQLPLELPSYASELKELGYATAFMGKWLSAVDAKMPPPVNN